MRLEVGGGRGRLPITAQGEDRWEAPQPPGVPLDAAKACPESQCQSHQCPMWPDSPGKQLKRARIWSELQHTRPSGQQGRKARKLSGAWGASVSGHDEFQDGLEPFTGSVQEELDKGRGRSAPWEFTSL